MRIGHGGAIYGFSTQLEALPERRLGVAAAASLDGSNGVVERLANYALRLMIATQDGKPLPTYRVTGPIPQERIDELVGHYHAVDANQFVHITALNGECYLQRGSYRYQLGSAADNGSLLTDDATGFGTPVKLEAADRLSVAGTAFQRVADVPPADIPDHWKGLIGEYGWDHNTLYILEDNGQLYALIKWFYYYPLKQIDENTFAFTNSNGGTSISKTGRNMVSETRRLKRFLSVPGRFEFGNGCSGYSRYGNCLAKVCLDSGSHSVGISDPDS